MDLHSYIRKFLFYLLIGIASSVMSFLMAQNPPHSSSDKIIADPDVAPMYTGGTTEMHRFISNTLSYPPDAVARNAQGLVVYTFVVEKDGTLSNFNIIHRADSLLNEEALRILKSMPPWRPARHNGEVVRAETYVPMYFKLNKSVQQTTEAPKFSSSATAKAYAKTDRSFLENNDIYTIVDKMPYYKEGEKELSNFITHHIRYPREAMEAGIEGRILCSFIVAADGTVSNIEVVEGLHSSLNDESIRVLGLMPRWVPGENGGEKVNVKCLLPINFSFYKESIPVK